MKVKHFQKQKNRAGKRRCEVAMATSARSKAPNSMEGRSNQVPATPFAKKEEKKRNKTRPTFKAPTSTVIDNIHRKVDRKALVIFPADLRRVRAPSFFVCFFFVLHFFFKRMTNRSMVSDSKLVKSIWSINSEIKKNVVITSGFNPIQIFLKKIVHWQHRQRNQ